MYVPFTFTQASGHQVEHSIAAKNQINLLLHPGYRPRTPKKETIRAKLQLSHPQPSNQRSQGNFRPSCHQRLPTHQDMKPGRIQRADLCLKLPRPLYKPLKRPTSSSLTRLRRFSVPTSCQVQNPTPSDR